MPYDPNYPATNALIESAPMRTQFNGLKTLIDAVPTITGAAVDSVTTLPPYEPAAVTVNLSGNVLHLSFAIPQGYEGPQGPEGTNGTNGSDGPAGPPGETGPPFTNFVIYEVTTLPPGSNASVSAFFDGVAVRLSFGIPQGEPGEVTLAQLSDAILSTSNNSNAVAPLNLVVSDPPTQAEVQQIADKLDELINALRR